MWPRPTKPIGRFSLAEVEEQRRRRQSDRDRGEAADSSVRGLQHSGAVVVHRPQCGAPFAPSATAPACAPASAACCLLLSLLFAVADWTWLVWPPPPPPSRPPRTRIRGSACAARAVAWPRGGRRFVRCEGGTSRLGGRRMQGRGVRRRAASQPANERERKSLSNTPSALSNEPVDTIRISKLHGLHTVKVVCQYHKS